MYEILKNGTLEDVKKIYNNETKLNINIFMMLCHTNRYNILKYLLSFKKNKRYEFIVMIEICMIGDDKICRELLDQYNASDSMEYFIDILCEQDRLNLVIEYRKYLNSDSGFLFACRNNKIRTARYIYYNNKVSYKIIKEMFETIDNYNLCKWLYKENSNLELPSGNLKFNIDHSKDIWSIDEYQFIDFARSNNIKIIEIGYNKLKITINWNSLLCKLSYFGCLTGLIFVLEKLKIRDIKLNINNIFLEASNNGHVDILDYLYKLYHKDIDIDNMFLKTTYQLSIEWISKLDIKYNIIYHYDFNRIKYQFHNILDYKSISALKSDINTEILRYHILHNTKK